jgi:hypothetical protein
MGVWPGYTANKELNAIIALFDLYEFRNNFGSTDPFMRMFRLDILVLSE